MTGATHTAGRALGIRRRGAKAAARPKPPLERSLLQTATLCLLALGVVMVFSASSTTSLLGESGDGAFFVKRTLLFGAIGLAVMHGLALGGLRWIRIATPAILIGSIGLLFLVLLPGFGVEANGATRWLAAGPIQLQPSEIAKLALIFYGASLLAKRPRTVASIGEMTPYLLVTGLVGGLILIEPDLGTALVATFAVSALLIAGGAQIRHLLLIGAVITIFALLAILIEPYRQDRITGFLNPSSDAGGAGFQGTQATIALGSGGLFGVGLGESVQKAFYLPEAHTDMIAAVIGEEVGLLGLAVVVGLYGLFGYGGFRIAQRAKDRYGKLLAAGLTAMILAQATLNLFAVLGLAPLTGVPLPFVSYGNSNLIIMLAAVGVILNVSRTSVGEPGRAG
ncbi:MAG: putative lipid II flippase FtsW, partial [Solirubrobacterales bacterium]